MRDLLCAFSLNFSARLGGDLEDARSVRHQFRETTWTDRLIYELSKLRDPRIIVAKSKESLTGADMDWWFVNQKTKVCIRLTVQAKILHYLQKSSARWHYEDLAHPAKDPGRQAADLIRFARSEQKLGRSCYPFYIFYNPYSVRGIIHPCCSSLASVTMIDGYAVNAHIKSVLGSKAAPFPIDDKRFSTLSPMMISMASLFCDCRLNVPTPEIVSQIIDLTWPGQFLANREIRAPSRPKMKLQAGVPREIAYLIETRGGSPEDSDVPVSRDTIIFISGDD